MDMDNSINEEISSDGDFLQNLGENFSFSENEHEEIPEEEESLSEEVLISDLDSNESLRSTDSESESSDDIVYEHALKHSTFFETARNRRRRHLHNRIKGKAPSFCFTGTRKTHFWSEYGVKPAEEVPTGRIHGIETLFTEDEFKKLGPFERRIHVNGQKFKVVPNQSSTDSLYRAIAQAIGIFHAESHLVVRDAIMEEILKQWHIFSGGVHQFCMAGGKRESELRQSNPEVVLELYTEVKKDRRQPPEFELAAAALHFGFTYSIMDVINLVSPVKVRNCTNEIVLKLGTVKFNFLRSGTLDSFIYEFLIPIGPLRKIHDGQYPLILREVLVVKKSAPSEYSPLILEKENSNSNLGPLQLGFALDHRIFLHRSTISHDLWSLLAELLFKKLIHAPQIKHKVVDSKHNFALYYFACKAKKRYQISGNASIHKLAEDFSERFSKEDSRGDVEDLAQAAAYFDFSYTLIGMDARGNFFWVDRVSSQDGDEESPYLAFFVKTTPDKQMFWYALEDVGRNCPKERKLYSEVQNGDLRLWEGQFYFRYVPKKIQNLRKHSLEYNNLSRNPSYLYNRASQWAVLSARKLRSRISTASDQVRNMFQRIVNFLRWMVNRRSVKPEGKKVQALFIRDQP